MQTTVTQQIQTCPLFTLTDHPRTCWAMLVRRARRVPRRKNRSNPMGLLCCIITVKMIRMYRSVKMHLKGLARDPRAITWHGHMRDSVRTNRAQDASCRCSRQILNSRSNLIEHTYRSRRVQVNTLFKKDTVEGPAACSTIPPCPDSHTGLSIHPQLVSPDPHGKRI